MATVSSMSLMRATLSALTPVTPAETYSATLGLVAVAVLFSAAPVMAFKAWVMWSTKACKRAWSTGAALVALPLAASSALKTAAKLASVTPVTRWLKSATVGTVPDAVAAAALV